jgi:hypothetical protein
MENRLANARTESRHLVKTSRHLSPQIFRTRRIKSQVKVRGRIQHRRTGFRREIAKETIEARSLNELRNHGRRARATREKQKGKYERV